MNPYFDTTFFGWFWVFLCRCFEFVTGGPIHLYSDEIQVFSLIAFSCAASFLGTFLLLKKLTMMANALSHTMLLGVVVAYLVSVHAFSHDEWLLATSQGALFGASLIVSFVTVGLVHLLSSSRYISSDAANGMTFTFLFAVGISLLSLLCKNSQVGTEMIMGNVDMLTIQDLSSLSLLSVSAIILGLICLRGFTVSTFDPVFALFSHMRPALLDLLLLTLVGVTTIFAFRAVGFILALSFFVTPPLIARILTHRLHSMIGVSLVISLVTCFVGVALSRHLLTVFALSVSTQALITCLLSCEFLLVLFLRAVRRVVTQKESFVS